jgi:membrane protein implicated in regulation of membrane protease activity
MLDKSKAALAAGAVACTAIVAGGGIADAASHHKRHTKRHATSTTSGSSRETALTGDTATKAKDAAVAAVGGTAGRASTEDPSDASGAAYEVHVTKADGTKVEVLEDSSFNVIKVQADSQRRGRHGHGGRRGAGNGETELTGDTATSAKNAAVAAVGGTAWRASTEDPSDSSGAAYEVHVTKDDGSEVEVLEDSSFNVIKVQSSPQSQHPDRNE